MPIITSVAVEDIRFPTALTSDGSDDMNRDGGYSAAYVVARTDGMDALGGPLAGYGLTFTIGRGNDIVVAALQQARQLVGKDVAQIAADTGGLYRFMTSDSQFGWLGPEKGVVNVSLSAHVNAAWDLLARFESKPLWRLLADKSPEELADIADLRCLSDALTRDARRLFPCCGRRRQPGGRRSRA